MNRLGTQVIELETAFLLHTGTIIKRERGEGRGESSERAKKERGRGKRRERGEGARQGREVGGGGERKR